MTNKQFGIIGLSAPILFSITYLVMSSLRPEYSFLNKAISELGSTDAPHKWFWNVFGYMIPGILISVFSIGHYRSMAQKASSKLPMTGIFLSGLFMLISGIFPGDFNDKSSLTMLLHSIGSFGSYIFFLMGAFTYPQLMKKHIYWKSAAIPSLVFTWLTIVFGIWPFVFTQIPGVGQRIVFSLYFLWIAFNSYMLYKCESRSM